MMEMDELKQIWQEYNKTLEKNLQVNEELIRTMKLKMVTDIYSKFQRIEIISLCMTFLFMLFIIQVTWVNRQTTALLLCGIVSLAVFIFAVVSSMKSLQLLYKIDQPENSVAEMQKHIAKYEMSYQLGKKIGLIIFPIGILALSPLATSLVQGFNIFDQPLFYLRQAGIAILAGFPVLLLIYKVYEKKMKKAREYLNQLEAFSKEE